MPIPKLDGILQEFSFTQAEALNAQILSPLLITWLQDKYARKLKQKAVAIIPADKELDRDYLLSLGEMEGYLSMLQELFMEHKEAMELLQNPEFKQQMEVDGSVAMNDLATRAAQQVDQT